jgi:hypothetical protein
MAFGRKRPEQSSSGSKESSRITSYPVDQDGKAPVVGELRTTSYKSAMQTNRRDYQTIN